MYSALIINVESTTFDCLIINEGRVSEGNGGVEMDVTDTTFFRQVILEGGIINVY